MSKPLAGTVSDVDLFGQRIRYRTAGNPDGPAVLLVHGLGSSGAEWGPALELLSHDAYLIAPDLPGFGGSHKGRTDYSLGAFANALRDLLDHLGVEVVTVVGHSMGGGVSLMFAYQYPDRVRDLVLVSAGGLGPEVTPLLRAATIPFSTVGLKVLGSRPVGAVLGAATVAARFVPGMSAVGVEQLAHGFRAFADAESRSAFQATARSVIDRQGQRVDATSRLSLTRGRPLLFIHGNRDRFIPLRHSAEAHAQVPGSQLAVFAGAGHYPHLDDPEQFASLVRAHMRRG